MNNLEREYCRADAEGCKRISSFSGPIPEAPKGFEVDDIFTIPTQFQVFESEIGGVKNQFIFVTNQYGEVKRFYPSQLSRRVRAYNYDGTLDQLVIADGSASRLYKTYRTVQDGMEALKGKTIRVSAVTKVFTLCWECAQHKTVYTFDLV